MNASDPQQWRDNVDKKLDEIRIALMGHPMDKQDLGLMGRVHKLEEDQEKTQRWVDKTVAWAMGVCFGGGALITVLVTIIINHVKK